MTTRTLLVLFTAITLTAFSAERCYAEHTASPAEGHETAVARTEATTGTAGVNFQKRHTRYVIQPSDKIELRFSFTPGFNQTVIVQPDGYITLLNIGDLRAAGRTLPELTDSIKTAYSTFLHDPIVSVNLKEFQKPYFVVGGQVGRPGKFFWRSDVTLTEAIAMAGGFTAGAKTSQVLFFRRVSNHWAKAKIIDVKAMIKARNLQEDPVLRPGDMLFVPKSTFSKFKHFIPTASTGLFVNPANY